MGAEFEQRAVKKEVAVAGKRPAPSQGRPAAKNQRHDATPLANGQHAAAAATQSHWAEPHKHHGEPDIDLLFNDIDELIAEIETSLTPAYEAAVSAHDAAGALELARAVAAGLARLGAERDRAQAILGQEPATPMQNRALDLARLAGAAGRIASLDARLKVALGPRRLRPAGEPVQETGAVDEAANVVGILATVDQVKSLLGHRDGQCEATDPGNVAAAASVVEAWRGRPANWRFLVETLTEEGLWQVLADQKMPSGQTLAKVDSSVTANAEAFGELTDVGSFDMTEVETLVPVDQPSLSTTDAGLMPTTASSNGARKVYAMVASAAPGVRGALIKRLVAGGRLDALCDAWPRKQIEELMRAVDDREAKALLAARIEGKGGGRSVTSMIEGQVQEDLVDAEAAKNRRLSGQGGVGARVDELAAQSKAFGWQLLESIYHGGTFGFTAGYDEAYDAREAGMISENAFTSTVTTQALESGALALATSMTGGAVGSWSSGVARALGAGQGLQAFIGGTLGGGAAGLAGQAVGDAFNGEVSGLGAYGNATLMGLGGGALTSGVAVAGSKYLPTSVKTLGQVYAEKYPGLETFFREWSAQGLSDGRPIRVAVDKVRALIDAGLVPPDEGSRALAASGPGGSFLVKPGGKPGELSVSYYGAHEVAEHYAEETAAPSGGPNQEELDEAGNIHGATERQAGVATGHRHHVLPQEYRAWFAARGIDIDDYCVEMSEADHAAQHGGGNFRLARSAWKEGEWNHAVMKLLERADARSMKRTGKPLSPEEIIGIVKQFMAKRNVPPTFVRYRSPRSAATSVENEAEDG